ncbi:hypothetical protein JIP0899_240006 [Flavobacterium psychrophilum]|nr:hypothetical protein JIP0899_240006 [Flavobacterium psychrophilum]
MKTGLKRLKGCHQNKKKVFNLAVKNETINIAQLAGSKIDCLLLCREL